MVVQGNVELFAPEMYLMKERKEDLSFFPLLDMNGKFNEVLLLSYRAQCLCTQQNRFGFKGRRVFPKIYQYLLCFLWLHRQVAKNKILFLKIETPFKEM